MYPSLVFCVEKSALINSFDIGGRVTRGVRNQLAAWFSCNAINRLDHLLFKALAMTGVILIPR